MSNGTATRLTETQRTLAAERLTGADRRFIVAALVNDHPEVFDSIVADLKNRPAELSKETTR